MSRSIVARLTGLALLVIMLLQLSLVPGTMSPVLATRAETTHDAARFAEARSPTVVAAACAQARVFLPLVVHASAVDTVPTPATPPTAPACSTPSPPADITALARRVLVPSSQLDARQAVAEIFGKAGVATVFDAGTVHRATAPTMPFHLRELQTGTMAEDAALRATGSWRLSLADLGALLHQLGWQLPDDGDGTVLVQVLAEAIRAAHADPGSPHSFTPLFLQAMAAATQPDLDLGAGTADPRAVRLSAMEAQLFLFQHFRTTESYGSDAAVTSAIGAAGTKPAVTASASSACGDFENALGQLDPMRIIKAAFMAGIDKVVGIPFEKFYEKLGITSSAGKLAIANALNLINIVMTTRAIQFSVTADKTEAHASHVEHDDVLRPPPIWNNVTFSATASAKNVYADYPALADCLKLLGLFGPENMEEVLQKARVVWDASGLGARARVGKLGTSLKNPRPDQYPLTYTLGKTLKRQLIVDMNPEPGGPYPNNPLVLRQRVFMSASLDTSQMPDFKDLIKAVIPGGLPDAILGIANQALKKIIAPVSQASFIATWHPAPCQADQGTLQGLAAASGCPYTVTWSRIFTSEHESTVDKHYQRSSRRLERHGSALVYLETDPQNPLATVLKIPTAGIVVSQDQSHESRWLGDWGYYEDHICASRSESSIVDGDRWAGRHALPDIRAFHSVPYRHTDGLAYWPIHSLRMINQPQNMTTFADYNVQGWIEDTGCTGVIKRREFSNTTDATIDLEKSPPDQFVGGSYIKGDAAGMLFSWTNVYEETTESGINNTVLESWTVEAPCRAVMAQASAQPAVQESTSACR